MSTPQATQLGRYQLLRKLAAGGMAEVFLARADGPSGFQKSLVIKKVLPHLAEDREFIEMFLAEAKLAAQLNHPNIVQIFDFGESNGEHFLAMELIDGLNLRALLREARAKGMSLPPAACAKIASFACEGLAYAHEFTDPATGQRLGLIHRDVSPDNILLSRTGAVKVVDFGIAKAASTSPRTQTGVLKGKISYMPPEQLTGERLDHRVDVYALGVVLYELLTGAKPFVADSDVAVMQAVLNRPMVSARERRPGLPDALYAILDRALAKDREQRHRDCRELRGDLERYLLSEGIAIGAYELSGLVASVTDPKVQPGMISPSGELSPTHAFEPSALALANEVAPSWGEPSSPTAPGPRRSGRAVPLAIAGAVAVLALAAAGYSLLGRKRPAPVAAAEEVAPVPVAPGAVSAPASRPGPVVRGAAEPGPDEPAAAELPGGGPATTVQSAVAATPPPPAAAELAGGRPATTAPSAVAATPPPPTRTAPSRRVERPRRAALGTVEFRVRPAGTIFIDGKRIGQTPFPAVQVAAGKRRIRVVNPDTGESVELEFQVRPDQHQLFRHAFE